MCLEKHFECVCLSLAPVSSLVSAWIPNCMHLVGHHHQLLYVSGEAFRMCLSFSDTCFKPRVCVCPNCMHLVGYHHQLFYVSELEKHFECVCLSLTLFQASCLRVSQIVCICRSSPSIVCTCGVCLSLTLCVRVSDCVCILNVQLIVTPVCVYVCVFMSVSVCEWKWVVCETTSVCESVYVCVCECVWVFVCECVCECMCEKVCVCGCEWVCVLCACELCVESWFFTTVLGVVYECEHWVVWLYKVKVPVSESPIICVRVCTCVCVTCV